MSLTELMEGKIPSSLTLLRSTTQARGHLLLDSDTKHAQNQVASMSNTVKQHTPITT